jgi:hypothetical protein
MADSLLNLGRSLEAVARSRANSHAYNVEAQRLTKEAIAAGDIRNGDVKNKSNYFPRFYEQAKRNVKTRQQPTAAPKRVSKEARAFFEDVQGLTVARAAGVKPVKKKKGEKRDGPKIKLTEVELILAVEANNRTCLCGSPFGGYHEIGGNYFRHTIVQMHVEKTVAEGADWTYVVPGCHIANKLHGDGIGMPLAELKAKIAANAPRYVPKLTEGA